MHKLSNAISEFVSRYRNLQQTGTVTEKFEAITRFLENTLEENDRLRAALANSELPCVYCGLSAKEWIKCQHGFPGCARFDDVAAYDPDMYEPPQHPCKEEDISIDF
jgi:hypothetical protein